MAVELPQPELPKPAKSQSVYCARWTAGVACFNAILVAVNAMDWPWALALAPLLGVSLGLGAFRRAYAAQIQAYRRDYASQPRA